MRSRGRPARNHCTLRRGISGGSVTMSYFGHAVNGENPPRVDGAGYPSESLSPIFASSLSMMDDSVFSRLPNSSSLLMTSCVSGFSLLDHVSVAIAGSRYSCEFTNGCAAPLGHPHSQTSSCERGAAIAVDNRCSESISFIILLLHGARDNLWTATKFRRGPRCYRAQNTCGPEPKRSNT